MDRFSTLPRRELLLEILPLAQAAITSLTQASEHYGPEALEWHATLQATLATVSGYATGEKVSRFRLDLAADAARCAANAMANAAQLIGPAPGHERYECAIATAAFTADCARAKSPNQAAHCASRVVLVKAFTKRRRGRGWG
jgi:hypothetical protein